MKHLLFFPLLLLVCACGSVQDNNGAADAATGASADADPSAPDGDPVSSADAAPGASQCNTNSHVCVPTIPASWSGPVILSEGAAGAGAPACPLAYDNALDTTYSGLDSGSATCQCECGAATNVSCGNATLRGYSTNSCTGGGGIALPPASVGTCQQTIPDSNYFRFTAPTVSGGSCAPSANEDFDSPTWTTQVTACSLTDSLDACGSDVSCAPKPPAAFLSAICIAQRGEHSCPAGAFSERYVRHEGYSDTRKCAGCTCGSPTGSCAGTVRIKHNASGTCTGGTTDSVLTAGQCGYAPSGEQASYAPNPSAMCTPTGTPSVSGGVTETDATTYCCMAI